MTTEDIARAIKLTAQLMELHEENTFKVRSMSNAAFKIDKTGVDLGGLTLEELEKIDGIGKSIAKKIVELNEKGETKELRELLDKTPQGVIEMLGIKGIGPKKVGLLWRELGIESVGELLYACQENRLVTLKGFGEKTQEQVRKAIEFRISNSGKFHYATVEAFALELVEKLKKRLDTEFVSLTGAIRRKCEILDSVEILAAVDAPVELEADDNSIGIRTEIHICSETDFFRRLLETTGSDKHLALLPDIPDQDYSSEEEIYEVLELQYIEPELREGIDEVQLARAQALPELIQFSDLKGILHNHTTYSDGLHTLRDMAEHCKKLGYEYLGICDHSRSAFYANGLDSGRVLQQQKEIDALNKEMAPFRIFKGIESDILNDGSLDYEENILQTFDLVVASVHSNLKMDKEKATARVLKAVENPYTTILGHPTGRLLLSREGYPLDHKKIIDACAEHNVVIELNAHPYRLDIDWRWIRYCVEKGVMISINPDAHEKEGYYDMHYGTCAARKGMLTKEMCFNALSLKDIEQHLINRKK